jgi:mannose-1-phosphate guanylyltransferase
VNNTPIDSNFYAVIPAGGVGSRLWPLSRVDSPKFLLDFTGSGRSLLRETFDRVARLVPTQRILVVTGNHHAEAVAHQLASLTEGNLIAEPSPRESTAAIALAAAILVNQNPDAIIGSFAADHVIRNEGAFGLAVVEAVRLAASGKVATIGIKPTSPSSAYGYIRVGDPISEVSPQVASFAAEAFVEKPALAIAQGYLHAGNHLWNAGMFVLKASLLLEILGETQPELAAGVAAIAASWNTEDREDVLARVWPTLHKIAIDYSLAEPAAAKGLVAVVSAELDWTDVGDFASMSTLHPSDELTHFGPATVVGLESTGVVVSNGKKVIAVSGLTDVVIVETEDALLVTTKQQAQSVKAIVAELDRRGIRDVL